MTLPALIGHDLSQLETLVQSLGEPKFRAKQLYSWLYVKHARDFETMTNLAKSLRAKLQEAYEVGQLTIAQKQVSQDGTIKYLFQLADGQRVESVLMYFEERDAYSVCLSTQVGCAVNCDFCATGKLGFKRHLTAAEIVEQLQFILHDTRANVRNVVFMGQGEPLLNYDPTLRAIHLINQACEIGMRHITVSTSGIVPTIERLANEKLQLTLAVSLHAPDNETRSKIMPINQKYPLETLMPALFSYTRDTGRRLTIEYILLAGINDSPEQALALRQLLRGLRCNINLIPYNPIGDGYGYQRPTRAAISAFSQVVSQGPQTVTVRLERGADIAAACGQLANAHTQTSLPEVPVSV